MVNHLRPLLHRVLLRPFGNPKPPARDVLPVAQSNESKALGQENAYVRIGVVECTSAVSLAAFGRPETRCPAVSGNLAMSKRPNECRE